MSLINDALRRASEDDKNQATVAPSSKPPAEATPMEPVGSPPALSHLSRLVLGGLLLLIAVVVALGSRFAWKAWGNRGSKTAVKSAVTNRVARLSPPPGSQSFKTNLATVGSSVASNQTSVAPSQIVAVTATSALPVKVPPANIESIATTGTVARVLPSVKWPPLRLQGIIYNPPNSSVLINNKMLFIDDEIQGVKVVEIGRQSAAVVLGGQTNTLSLR